MSEELNEVVDAGDETESVPESVPEIQYTKTGRVKVNRPRTQAQIDAFAKARAKWEEMRRESTELKKQATLKSSEVTLQKKQQDAEAEAAKKCERAIKKYQKQKAKIVKNDPMPELTEDKPVEPDVPDVPDVPDTPEPEPVKRVVRKKKPVVIVQDDSESELESDDPQVIVVKRKSKAKPKEPVPDPRFKPAQSNPFARNYFYSPTAMS
jgi:seryl-tRNA synthetase